MSATKYTAPHMMLHWTIAVLVILQIGFADAMAEAFDARLEGISVGSDWTGGAIVHAMIGASIGLLMIWRLGLRLTTDIPPPPPEASTSIQIVSRVTHWMFYGILIGMPMAGALAWFIPSEPMAEAHEVTASLLLALIALHITGAMYHHFVMGDKAILRRMLPR
ncbi:cytochrome b [Loktanella sp. DJP18]|uniref:cytochrome b n=1 Tax=Loktanella sp. DJP18 TaxID=3409788 RepID=UPI003BB71A13